MQAHELQADRCKSLIAALPAKLERVIFNGATINFEARVSRMYWHCTDVNAFGPLPFTYCTLNGSKNIRLNWQPLRINSINYQMAVTDHSISTRYFLSVEPLHPSNNTKLAAY
jgi:hypothetical protein